MDAVFARLAALEGRLAQAEARLAETERQLAAKPALPDAPATDETHPKIEEALRLHCHGMSPETRRVTRRAVLHRYAGSTGSNDERADGAIAYLQKGEIETVRAYLES